jgi:ABC-2 type transport system ATP-binding protein
MRKLIKECGKENTVIVSSHILFEIGAVCDRVIVINEGQLIADDTPTTLTASIGTTNRLSARIKGNPSKVTEALLDVESVRKVDRLDETEPGVFDYIISGKESHDIREDVFLKLASKKLPLLSSQSAATSLEEVFLKLTGSRV